MVDKLYKNEAWLREQYTEKRRSSVSIAEELDTTPRSVLYWLRAFEIPTRGNSDAHMGQSSWNAGKRHIYSEDSLKKMSDSHKGNPGGMAGKKHTPESKQKNADAHIGHSPNKTSFIRGQSPWNKGVPCTQVSPLKGIPRSEETRKKMSEKLKGHPPNKTSFTSDRVSGAKNVNWKDGISFKPYCHKFNYVFKERVREEFGRKCYMCHTNESKRRLSVHHIDYNHNSICNGNEWAFVPLCAKCHPLTNFDRWHWFNKLIYYWLNDHFDFNLNVICNDP